MPAPTLIQTGGTTLSSSSNTDFVLASVASGSTLVLLLTQGTSATRVYTVSDATNGAWSQAGYTNPARAAGIWYMTNSASGTINVTIDQDSTHIQYEFEIVEISSSTFDVASTFNTASTTTTHYCAQDLSIDTQANTFILSVGRLSGTGGTLTKNGDFTLINTATNSRLAQYRASDSSIADERCEFTSTTPRGNQCACASFIAAASGLSIPVAMNHYRQIRGN